MLEVGVVLVLSHRLRTWHHRVLFVAEEGVVEAAEALEEVEVVGRSCCAHSLYVDLDAIVAAAVGPRYGCLHEHAH
jgi:hypothetical protein